jgi:hypothetical protein
MGRAWAAWLDFTPAHSDYFRTSPPSSSIEGALRFWRHDPVPGAAEDPPERGPYAIRYNGFLSSYISAAAPGYSWDRRRPPLSASPLNAAARICIRRVRLVPDACVLCLAESGNQIEAVDEPFGENFAGSRAGDPAVNGAYKGERAA